MEKRNGWVNVGDLQGAVHFKIVRYERIKFLVVGLESMVEIYAWAPKPYHKFMAFKVCFDVLYRFFENFVMESLQFSKCSQSGFYLKKKGTVAMFIKRKSDVDFF